MGNAKDRPGGARRVREPKWVMGRTGGRGGGVDGVKDRSGKWEGPAGGGGSTGYITHLCIMHGAHTSIL